MADNESSLLLLLLLLLPQVVSGHQGVMIMTDEVMTGGVMCHRCYCYCYCCCYC